MKSSSRKLKTPGTVCLPFASAISGKSHSRKLRGCEDMKEIQPKLRCRPASTPDVFLNLYGDLRGQHRQSYPRCFFRFVAICFYPLFARGAYLHSQERAHHSADQASGSADNCSYTGYIVPFEDGCCSDQGYKEKPHEDDPKSVLYSHVIDLLVHLDMLLSCMTVLTLLLTLP